MRLAFVASIGAVALLSVISAADIQTTPVPATKLRADTNMAPQQGGRRLGFWDWLIESPTAAPATPSPITNTYDNDDKGFEGFDWTLGGDNTRK
ncbi:hypothetical protein JG687_00015014 [Phytophthora cactorum]|uniref:RxLR effector protein n=1 Tax=Phytophthora cactorum TaxID=29920 RepID=A0A329SYE3_9STRA|nr:hypothetical protein Pcac1_g14366 [Phytophthora cactorum]KAG2836312.1 hypothetical protein PC111_g5086 [Phytophthora cactorum]KAG2846443.1 hypothetical protein PC113_g17973 [Phytophthora cactorum]KAG2885457.1 hypothetical protein PC114_g19652 [Phytophthora cactorum]KAG2896468.1 hypothetical protein PC115_g17515 [Phytophthora cactorum]